MIKVTLKSLTNAGPKQTAFAAIALQTLGEILNSPGFLEKVRTTNYTVLWKKIKTGEYSKTTPEELVDTITSGKEYHSESDSEIDFELNLKSFSNDNIIGSTPLGGTPINTSYKFINDCLKKEDPVKLASHWMHEWMHCAGFYHVDQDDDDFNDGVYTIGRLIKSIGYGQGSSKAKGKFDPAEESEGASFTSDNVIYETGASIFHLDEKM